VLASIQLCEAFHKVRRLKEESMLLERELAQYVQYCEERVQDLQHMVFKIENEQRPLLEVLGAAGIQSVQRYFCASAFQAATDSPLLTRFPQAICALLRAGIAEYSKHITSARQIRQHPEGSGAFLQAATEVQHGDAAEADGSMSDDSEVGEL
jgi:hypothetical protein